MVHGFTYFSNTNSLKLRGFLIGFFEAILGSDWV